MITMLEVNNYYPHLLLSYDLLWLLPSGWHTATHNEYSSIIFNQQFYWHTQTTRSEIWLMAAWVSSIRMHWTIHYMSSTQLSRLLQTIVIIVHIAVMLF